MDKGYGIGRVSFTVEMFQDINVDEIIDDLGAQEALEEAKRIQNELKDQDSSHKQKKGKDIDDEEFKPAEEEAWTAKERKADRGTKKKRTHGKRGRPKKASVIKPEEGDDKTSANKTKQDSKRSNPKKGFIEDTKEDDLGRKKKTYHQSSMDYFLAKPSSQESNTSRSCGEEEKAAPLQKESSRDAVIDEASYEDDDDDPQEKMLNLHMSRMMEADSLESDKNWEEDSEEEQVQPK